MVSFNAKNLDIDFWKSRAEAEATLIFNKPSTRKGRTKEQILEAVLYGHAAEVYLIKNENYTDDRREYKDVIDPQKVPTEIKVTEGEYYVPHVLKRANEAKLETWRKYPDKLMIFIGNKKTYDYYLYGTYYWNKKQCTFA